jgi:O-antigen ligase
VPPKNSPVKFKSEITTWLFNSSFLITVYFNSRITDPFNSPKFWSLIICASVLCGPILTKKITLKQSDQKLYNLIRVVVYLFITSALVSTLLSYNIQASVFGENFRRNGLLTIISFLLMYIGAIKFVNFHEISKLFNTVLVTSLVVGGYALMQITKNDFIVWSNPNSIITTLGNTNFAGAVMAILLILCFGQFFLSSTKMSKKLILATTTLLLLITIRATQARQAIIILLLGILIIALFLIYDKNNKIGKISFSMLIPVSLLSVLGMLQIGPLQDLLYKGSLSIRGYYWRAGLKMFTENPFFGVGIDNYGKFFKEVREVNYSLSYGFSITSSNAHNTIIQYFATGGFLVGFSYLLLQIITLYCALKLILRSHGDEKKIAVTIFAAWVAFQAQSLISIENIGVAIWGWLLSGSLIGLYFSDNESFNAGQNFNKKSIQIDWRSTFVSGVSIIVAIFLVIQLYSGEKNTYLSQSYLVPESTDPAVKESFNIYAARALNSAFIDNDYKNIVLSSKFDMGYKDEALKELEEIIRVDPRNIDTLLLLSRGNETLGNVEKAITYKRKIAELDPWNAQNYRDLGVLYRYIEDYDSMQAMLDKILSFASDDPISVTAKNELVKPTK